MAADDPPPDVITWLLAGDPSIRWQVLRDLTTSDPALVAAERARVAAEGWGARLLAEQADGRWATLRCLRVLRWWDQGAG